MTGRGRILGYVRVSSLDQNTARQLEGIESNITFEEKVSGKNMERPQLQALMQTAHIGDTVVIHSMDRLARNLIDLKTIVSGLVAKGAEVKFIKENLTFSGKSDHYSELMLIQPVRISISTKSSLSPWWNLQIWQTNAKR